MDGAFAFLVVASVIGVCKPSFAVADAMGTELVPFGVFSPASKRCIQCSLVNIFPEILLKFLMGEKVLA
ncbi:hypothetical protein RJT34_08797 [Clitoria ternatea]|uniref:Secreted protein n=1 Tax=Clitoria ternatea TaxID=43366 RepID=A0AAN9K671_CLITE